ncbi:hypothetical protein [Rhizomonospora bruguierae]|uniref:hypothetical protein n=1 Tax=Rhizomonospora bruguierae TaxID=1581705 RepID=UPI001BCA73C4|nr:hypothetical protein [Micromonospora sp. NBRC 107566]
MYRRFAIGSLTALLALLLAACDREPHSSGSADGGTGPDVASLASASPSATAGAASTAGTAAADEPPLIRPDTSEEEENRLQQRYNDCLVEHGANPKVRGPAEDTKKTKAAEQACANKKPEELWERARRTDPEYADKLRDWVTCVRSHGIDAWEEDGFITFKSLPPDNQFKYVQECESKAFASSG